MIEGQEGVSWGEWLALARACEESGLEGLFRSDHYGGVLGPGRGSLDAWATLAALAAVTGRIRLGTLVSPATFRHPAELAKVAATVDHVSGGRVELGLGAGWNVGEHESFGFPFPELDERMELLAEQLEIVVRSWTEEEFSFEGRHYRLEGCRAEPKPLQQPRPPLIMGGLAGPRSVRLAVRFADEYNVVYRPPGECRELRAEVAGACERAGRDPVTMTFSLMTGCIVGRDRGEVEERAGRVAALSGVKTQDLLEGEALVAGTVEEVVARLREYEGAGVERAYLQHLDHADVELVRLVGAEVVPAVA